MARAILTRGDFKNLPIPQGLLAWWDGTYTSIPDGWEIANGGVSSNDPGYTKPSCCNGRFPRCVAAVDNEAGAMGGSATHTHTGDNHTHSHTYGYTQYGTSAGGSMNATIPNHTHAIGSSAISLAAKNHEPSNVASIPIVYTPKGNSTRGLLSSKDIKASGLPPLKLIFGWRDAIANIPQGWTRCNGATVNGVTTPNLIGKFLRGIPTTSTEPGTVRGTTNHTHDLAHTHGTSGPSLTCHADDSETAMDNAGSGHTHTLTTLTLTSSSASNDPPYEELHYLCFTGYGNEGAAVASACISGADLSESLLIPRGLKAIWGFTLANIPSGWGHCDGSAWANGTPTGHSANKPDMRNRMIKHVANSTTNGGTITMNESHTHDADAHTHSVADTTSTWAAQCSWTTGSYARRYHGHSAGGPSYSAALTANNLPPCIDVAFIVRD